MNLIPATVSSLENFSSYSQLQCQKGLLHEIEIGEE
jgi:hypothetical protein